MRSPILTPNSPGLYRNQRGMSGNHPAMMPEGPRVVITTGETDLPVATASPPSLKAALHPDSVAFALIVLLALLLLIHARFTVGAQAAIGTKR